MKAVALVLLLVPTTVLALPDVTEPGPHAVSFQAVTFTKTSVTTGEPRQLDTTIWYPTRSDPPAQGPSPVLRGRWPLIVFSHGSCGFPGQSSFLLQGLASWGFIVAAPPHPGNTTVDDDCFDPAAILDSFENRPADVTFVIDQLLAAAGERGSPFFRRLKRRRIGVTGHSFGGQTTLRVAAADARVRGAVALAPAAENLSARIPVPTMVLGAELDSLTPFETDSRAGYALLDGPRFLVELERTGHCAFAATCLPGFCGTGCEPGTLTTDEANALTLRYTISFFLRYVAGKRRFGRALLPDEAPDAVRVREAHPRG
jgi:predicted dienelactone hydrolase